MSVYVLGKILGRVGPDIKFGETLSFYEIMDAVNTVAPGAEFEVYKEIDKICIYVGLAKISEHDRLSIINHIKRNNPSIAQMIASELLHEIEVRAKENNDLSLTGFKRGFIGERK